MASKVDHFNKYRPLPTPTVSTDKANEKDETVFESSRAGTTSMQNVNTTPPNTVSDPAAPTASTLEQIQQAVYNQYLIGSDPASMHPGNEIDLWYQIPFQILKECTAVFVFCILNSRIGYFDAATTPLLLYFILVVFAFPFMNPFLFAFLRLGPWAKEIGIKAWGSRILHVVIMSGAQLLGAYLAAHFRKFIIVNYGWETLDTPSGGAAISLHKECSVSNNLQTTWAFHQPYFTENEPSFKKDAACYDNNLTFTSQTFWVSEEIIGVALFLIGLVHLIEADEHLIAPLMPNTFWHKEPYKAVEKLDPTRPCIPIPAKFIACVSVLFAGVLKAFPTSHLTPTVSLYLDTLEDIHFDNKGVLVHPEEIGWRILGGVVGTITALIYYNAIYVYGGTHTPRAIFSSILFFQSKAPSPPTTYQPITFKNHREVSLKIF